MNNHTLDNEPTDNDELSNSETSDYDELCEYETNDDDDINVVHLRNGKQYKRKEHYDLSNDNTYRVPTNDRSIMCETMIFVLSLLYISVLIYRFIDDEVI
jgi:hypothetical protein